MSKTDKTDPWWIQIRRMPMGMLREKHWHHGHFGTTPECDLDFPEPATRRDFRHCELWPSYERQQKLWGRSRWRRSFRSFQDGRARADLRRLKAKWVREPIRGDIDSTENLPTSRWRWRRWYWD